MPAWAVDEVVDHWPRACGCGHVFGEGELVADGEPARHQVEELPAIHVMVSEHRCERVRCPDCGARVRGELPAGVAASAFGARYHAAVAVLSVRNRISRRDVVELCEQLFGSRISAGTIDAILARVGDALEHPGDDLLERVRAAQALNMDETGWRTAGQRRALWGAFTARHAVLRIASDRCRSSTARERCRRHGRRCPDARIGPPASFSKDNELTLASSAGIAEVRTHIVRAREARRFRFVPTSERV